MKKAVLELTGSFRRAAQSAKPVRLSKMLNEESSFRGSLPAENAALIAAGAGGATVEIPAR